MSTEQRSGTTRVVVASTVALAFISYWRGAAIVLSDLASSAFYAGGIAEQAIGRSAPWFVLAVMLFSYAVRALYIAAATWLGAFGFFFCAALACWIVYGVGTVFGTPLSSRSIAGFLFGAGVVASLYGVINAAWTRVNRITVRLANLPESWRGRVAALVSDTHLGHVRGHGFLRRIVGLHGVPGAH